ncbi:PqiC family protein [Pandoraea terrae]|nr:PqiC family protein [Pandoraea terrae]
MPSTLVRAAAAAALTIMLAACGSSPPTHFYTLSGAARTSPGPADGTTGVAGPVMPAAPYAVEVGPVAVPEQVDRPQFVTGHAPGQVNILEETRWAAPLKNELTSALSGALTQRLGAIDVWGLPRADALPVYRVSTSVQRFDSAPGEQAGLAAVWTVRRVPGDVLLTCRFTGAEAAPGGIDALVAAHRRLVDRLAAVVATAISTSAQGQTPRCG